MTLKLQEGKIMVDLLRWEEWDAATSAAMQRRAQQGQARSGSPELGYDSDLDQQDLHTQ